MQIFRGFFAEQNKILRLLKPLSHADSVCSPFGVIRPLLNGFLRTPSQKYASEKGTYLYVGDEGFNNPKQT